MVEGRNEATEKKRTLIAECNGAANTGVLGGRATVDLCTESPGEFSMIRLLAFAINKKSTVDRAMRKT